MGSGGKITRSALSSSLQTHLSRCVGRTELLVSRDGYLAESQQDGGQVLCKSVTTPGTECRQEPTNFATPGVGKSGGLKRFTNAVEWRCGAINY